MKLVNSSKFILEVSAEELAFLRYFAILVGYNSCAASCPQAPAAAKRFLEHTDNLGLPSVHNISEPTFEQTP